MVHDPLTTQAGYHIILINNYGERLPEDELSPRVRTLLERDRQATYVVIKRRLYNEESHT